VSLVAALMLVSRLAAAQPATGAIQGTVTGDAGNRLEAVTVTVQNQVTGERFTATTGADGRYEFTNLPVEGEYRVGVALAGFATGASESVALVKGAILIVNFKLKLSVTENISVSASTPLLEGVRSTVQQTVPEALVRTLPLVERNFIPLASLAAGFTGNPNYPNPQGQTFWSNNVVVDGASDFSKWRSAPRSFYSGYGLEAIKEVHVLTNRFSAEYGEALATVTSAVTKAGTNDLHGAALYFLQDDALNWTPTFALVNPPAHQDRFGVTLGGPFVRDRTHFFGSYEGRVARNHNIVTSLEEDTTGFFVPTDEDEHLAFFKIDHRLSDRHVMTARYNGQWFRWHDEPGGLSLPGSGTDWRNDVHTFLATDRLQLSLRTTNEVRFQFARYVDVRNDLNPSVFVSRAGHSQEGGSIGPLGLGADPEDTIEAADTVSTSKGPHTLRIGGGGKHVRAHNVSLSYGRGAYYFAGPPERFPQPYLFVQSFALTPDSAVVNPRSDSGFAFIQDDWAFGPRLTLNLGLRYDVEQVSDVRNFNVPADTNNVQPRVGGVWDPTGSGRTLVRGGVGLYSQQQLLYYINRVQIDGPDGVVTVSLAPGTPFFPTFPKPLTSLPAGTLPPRDIYEVDGGFHNPYSLQATVGVQRMSRIGVVSADYVYLNGRELMSLVDANAPASIVKPNQRSVAQADATRPLPVVPGLFRNILTLGNAGESWYHALQIKLERTTGRLQTLASYTYAHAEDLDNYQLPEDSRNLDAEKARANTDVRHNLSVGMTWQVPFESALMRNWSLSGIGIFRSGRPYTQVWGDDRNGTTQHDARPDGRNTLETDGYQNVDVVLARKFPAGATTIEGRFEVFNLFNTTNYDEYVGTLNSTYYGQPINAFPQRRIQLAAIVRF